MKDNSKANNKNEESSSIHKPLYANGYMWAAIIIACLSLLFYLSNINGWKQWEYLKDSENSFVAGLGTLGDYFGGVLNPLLTFITIILLIRSIEIQRADFRTQLKEQEEQKEEFKRQANAQESQLHELHIQNENLRNAQELDSFENKFFALLDQNNNMIQQSNFIDQLQHVYSELINKNVSNFYYSSSSKSEYIQSKLEFIFNITDSYTINTYLRFLYRFLKFLHDNKCKIGEKIFFYSGILRSIMSTQLLHAIAFNGLRNPSELSGFENYRYLLNEFKFLEHMNLRSTEYMIDSDEDQAITLNNIIGMSMEIQENTMMDTTELLKKNLSLCLNVQLFTSYSANAFDQNPYYINKILPALKYLVSMNKIDSSLLKTDDE